jgi:cell division transport system permease protein
MFTSSYRVTKFALQNFWRNIWLSVITISMLVMTMLTINVLLIMNFVTDQTIASVEDRIEVSVYFDEGTGDAIIDSAVSYLRGLSQVRDVNIVTADESLDRFRDQHRDDVTVLASIEELDKNPFGPTLVIKARDAQEFDLILDALENPQFRDSIREKDFSNYQQIVERIQQLTDRLRWFGVVLSVIFLGIAVLIVFNTVRVGIFIHREEIGIMRLVGASNGFIKAPFLLEMILLCLLATLVTIAIVYPALAIMEPKFSFFFANETIGLIDYFETNGLRIFGLEFLSLVVVTLLSTSLAMRKYLKI